MEIEMTETDRYCTHDRKPFFEFAAGFIKEGDRVLDAGGGNGDFARVTGRTDIHILDSNPVSVEKLKNSYPNARLGSVTDMPYEAESFDVIHCSHVVEHLQPEDVYLFMKGASVCLKDGGYLIVSAPTMWYGFYDDLSHIKPYNANVFIHYLCGENRSPRTREVIGGFVKEALVQRTLQMEDGTRINTGFTLVLKRVRG